MCSVTITEKADSYVATLVVEDRFAALRGFFAGFDAALNSIVDINRSENTSDEQNIKIVKDWFKECEAFRAATFAQPAIADLDSMAHPDSWTRL